MRIPLRKRQLESTAQVTGVEFANAREKPDVGEVFHPRVWSRPRHCVRVELFGDVRLEGIDPN